MPPDMNKYREPTFHTPTRAEQIEHLDQKLYALAQAEREAVRRLAQVRGDLADAQREYLKIIAENLK